MSDPDLSPEEQQVRRLLADARHDEPLPDDVADRLDGVLAGLHDDDRARRTSSTVDLAAARRRRRARNLLVAAAAVVVLGVGISQVDLNARLGSPLDGGSGDSAGSAAAPESAPDDGGKTALVTGRALVLSSDDFDRRVSRLASSRDLSALAERAQEYDAQNGIEQDTGSAAEVPVVWCDDAAWGRGQRIAVRYDGQRGVLVLRRVSEGSREVDLYLCGETTPTRSATVPAG